MRLRTRLLMIVPLLLAVLIAAVLIALPSFVSSRAHRHTIEALASSLTGRQVRIGGHLSLNILPVPQLIAERITIAGPADETITANSLVLDIAVPALLQGRLSASSLTLQSPNVVIPWPLPEGLKALSAPPWLTALHAQIENGAVTVGAVHFANVSADLFTGAGGALAVSGTAVLDGEPLTLSLGIGAGNRGVIPLTFDASSSDALKLSAHVSGTLHRGGALAAALTASAMLPNAGEQAAATATIEADNDGIRTTDLSVRQGNAALSGSAALDFATASLTLALNGRNLDFSQLAVFWRNGAHPPLPVKLTLDAVDSRFDGMSIPGLHARADASGTYIDVSEVALTLPGGSSLNGNLLMLNTGQFRGQAALTSGDLPALLTGYGVANGLPAAWAKLHVTTDLEGDGSHLMLQQVAGNAGTGAFTGDVSLVWPAGTIAAAGQLHFDRLDLTPLPGLVKNLAGGVKNFSAEGEVTIGRATYGGVDMTDLLLDAGIGQQLTVRRLSASLYGGMFATSFTLAGGQVTIARLLLSVPSAAPLAALLPAGWPLPAVLVQQPAAVSVLAEGPLEALATSGTATLGDLEITAAPIVDLSRLAAAGPLTLRYPNAIAAVKAFGYPAGLAWPGAGSIALRANFSASAGAIGLPDFVLSLGDLTAAGRLMLAGGKIDGDIAADTLALPPVPADVSVPWRVLEADTGTIKLTASQVLLGGAAVLGPSAASLTLGPHRVSLNVPYAGLANGTLSGTVTAATATKQAAQLSADVKLSGADAAAVNLPLSFPYAVPAGVLGGQAALTASGDTPADWAGSLAGSATLTGTEGTLNGFDLAGVAQALKPKSSIALRKAATAGDTRYDSLTISGNLGNGGYNINAASLLGPDGNASATGRIGGNDLALKISLMPKVTPPLTVGLAVTGRWAAARKIPDLRAALGWAPNPSQEDGLLRKGSQ
jgi:uncharacterized protein involved in outer membrane biogenesis